jgi:hypothetical protein
MVPARIVSLGLNMAAYALRAADDSLKVCLINEDRERGTRVGIETGGNFSSASLLRLTAPLGGGKNRGHAWRICGRRVRPLVSATP